MDKASAADHLEQWAHLPSCVFERSSLQIRACSDSLVKVILPSEGVTLDGSYVIDLFTLDSLETFENLVRRGEHDSVAQCKLAVVDEAKPSVLVALSPTPAEVGEGLLTMLCIPVPSQGSAIPVFGPDNASLLEENTKLKGLSRLLVHDLRGGLQLILGSLELARLGASHDIPTRLRTQLDRIERSSLGMKDLLEGVERLTRVEVGDYPFEVTDLNELVDSVIQGQAEEQSEQFSLKRQGVLPTLLCQRTLIAELFSNLIANGIKYGGEPPVEIRVGSVAQEMPTFFVRDNGVGIDPDDVGSVLLPLVRADRAELNNGGTGMGLALVDRIVKQHGGKVWIDSTLGHGTTVWFTLNEHGDSSFR